MNSQNFSGLFCMGLHTQDGHCTDNKMSIGSAADSMYEYMIKQWVLSGKTQEVGGMLQRCFAQHSDDVCAVHDCDYAASMCVIQQWVLSGKTQEVGGMLQR
jgi:hypothetical protein